MQYILSAGCSFSIPRPNFGVDTCVGKEISEYFKLKHLNIAEPSIGNDQITTKIKIFFEQFPERKKDTFAVVQFSYGGRLDYTIKNDKHQLHMSTANIVRENDVSEKLFPNVDLIEWTALKFYNSVIDMQNYFIRNNIKFYMYNGMQTIIQTPKKYVEHLKKSIVYDNFFNLDNQSYAHYKWCEDRNFLIPKDLHPDINGVTQYSTLLCKQIEKHKLL